jgi:hypothetical protein
MKFSNTEYKKTSKGGSVLLLKKIKIKSLQPPTEGGAILSNRIVGITTGPQLKTPIRSMMSMGGMIDFNKHVKTASKNIQKKQNKDENIKFVY